MILSKLNDSMIVRFYVAVQHEKDGRILGGPYSIYKWYSNKDIKEKQIVSSAS